MNTNDQREKWDNDERNDNHLLIGEW